MNIWLDDIRTPGKESELCADSSPNTNTEWIWVKTLAELEQLLKISEGRIEVMSFDHDLGENEPTGYDIIKWLQKKHLDRYPKITRVHSANPVGATNIQMFDLNVRKHLLGEGEKM